MKALELINELQNLVVKHGDITVECYNTAGDKDEIKHVNVLDVWRIGSVETEIIVIEP